MTRVDHSLSIISIMSLTLIYYISNICIALGTKYQVSLVDLRTFPCEFAGCLSVTKKLVNWSHKRLGDSTSRQQTGHNVMMASF